MRRVLIVDDSPEDWTLIRRAFAQAKFDCAIFEVDQVSLAFKYLEGAGAFADREAHPLPDLVLCDLNMPRQGGFELLDFINRGNWPTVKVALMSGAFSEETRSRARQKHACACISKDAIVWDIQAFLKAVEFCLEPDSAQAKC